MRYFVVNMSVGVANEKQKKQIKKIYLFFTYPQM